MLIMGHHTRDKHPVQQQSQRESGVRIEDLQTNHEKVY